MAVTQTAAPATPPAALATAASPPETATVVFTPRSSDDGGASDAEGVVVSATTLPPPTLDLSECCPNVDAVLGEVKLLYTVRMILTNSRHFSADSDCEFFQ